MIITIVVLLILAGITIANLTGGDGVIEQASSKKDETTIANEKQILGNAVISASDKFGEITENNLLQALNNQNVEITKSGPLYRIVFKDTNNLYKMNNDGEYFYWEDMAPTPVFGKIEDNILYLRATEQTGYTEGTSWTNGSITKVVIEEPIAPTTCAEMFKDCTGLVEIENIENLHTENSNSMYAMFNSCSNLTGIIAKFFDTTNVKSMGFMFAGCSNLYTIDLSNFNTEKVTAMNSMFNNCQNIEFINLTSFNTERILSMSYMFTNCFKLKEIDLSSFKSNSLSITDNMFLNCRVLEKIYVSGNLNMENVQNSSNMFQACSKLIGGNGTKYNSDFKDKTYARVDGGPNSSTPGYFTLKEN